jgi:hypothetical protein
MLEVAIASLKAVLAAEGLVPVAESDPAGAAVPEAEMAPTQA